MMQRRFCFIVGAALPAGLNACHAGSPMGGIDRGGARRKRRLDADEAGLDH